MISERASILGVGVSAINMDMALDTIDRWIAGRHHSYICVTGVHGVIECQSDPQLKRIHNQAGLVTPDGMPAANAYVAAVGMQHNGRRQLVDWCSARTDDNGRFRIDGLRAELEHRLLVRKDRFATVVHEVPEHGKEQRIDLGDVALRERRVLSGTVRDNKGDPVAGVPLTLKSNAASTVRSPPSFSRDR